jgi:hypothetical protein
MLPLQALRIKTFITPSEADLKLTSGKERDRNKHRERTHPTTDPMAENFQKRSPSLNPLA